MVAKHLFSEVLWCHLKEELHALAIVCLDLLYETDIWVDIKAGIYKVKLLSFILEINMQLTIGLKLVMCEFLLWTFISLLQSNLFTDMLEYRHTIEIWQTIQKLKV